MAGFSPRLPTVVVRWTAPGKSLLFGGVLAACLAFAAATRSPASEFRPVALTSQIAGVQPMTGIVLWSTNAAVKTAPIQLEYSYLTYAQVVSQKGEYNWAPVEALLNAVASRGHQAVLRWHDTYVGKPTGVPAYIKALPDYQETRGKSEGKPTGFPDWSNAELRRFTLEFFTRFAERYDRDPRLAFVEVGFGLWAEYHIYDGPMKLGKTFPSLAFQSEFARHLGGTFQQTPWMISVDAAGEQAPYASDPSLLDLPFGVFDDSFNHRRHAVENEPNWNALRRDRWKTAPGGGEFSFFQKVDQSKALAPKGPHGISFEQQAAKFHVSFIIGDGQPRFQPAKRIQAAGLACGYRFRVTKFAVSDAAAQAEITNEGIAPLYYDAFPAVNGVRSNTSLKGLLPGARRAFAVAAGGSAPKLTLECDRLVPGQRMGYVADLK